MAIYDAMFEFSDEQAITATAISTNGIDFINSDLEMGAGEPVYLNVKVGNTAFDSAADDGTLTVALVYDDTGLDTSSTVKVQHVAVAEASLTAGAWIWRQALPVDVDVERYVGVLYTVAGTGDFTAGTINAWLDHGPQSSYDTQVAESNI
jgi:hypothetical protein